MKLGAAAQCLFLLASNPVVLASGWKSDCDVHVKPGPGTPIQSAINSCSAGQRICVEAGTYAEQVTITKNGVSLIGHGAIIVPPASPGSNLCASLIANATTGVCVAGSGVVFGECPYPEKCKVTSVATKVRDILIQGLEIHGFGINLAVVGGDNTVVSGNTLVDGGYYGMTAVGSTNTKTTGNTVRTTSGLAFIAICTDNFSGVETCNNHITGYDVGLCIQTSYSQQYNNDVSGCCNGAFVDPGVQGAQIRSNRFGPTDPRCVGNWDTNGGVYIVGASGTHVEDNSIMGQSSAGKAPGIAIIDVPPSGPISSGNVVRHNVFANNDLDIYVQTNGTGNQIQGNRCKSSFPSGLC